MVILVSGHSRSGTHFIIDAIVRNFKGAMFSVIRPGFPSVENLFNPHDKGVTERFYDYVFSGDNDNEIRICKTHIIAEEFDMALSRDDYFVNDKDKQIVDYLYNQAKIIYMTRDVRDVLVSMYRFMRLGGGYQSGLRGRLADATVSEFVRSPNYRVMPCRAFSEIDKNLVYYWANHVKQWQKPNIYQMHYAELKNNFEKNIKDMSKALNWDHLLADNISEPKVSKVSGGFFSRLPHFLKLKLQPKDSTAVSPYKGVVGSHKSHFNEEDYAFIEANSQLVKENARNGWKLEGFPIP